MAEIEDDLLSEIEPADIRHFETMVNEQRAVLQDRFKDVLQNKSLGDVEALRVEFQSVVDELLDVLAFQNCRLELLESHLAGQSESLPRVTANDQGAKLGVPKVESHTIEDETPTGKKPHRSDSYSQYKVLAGDDLRMYVDGSYAVEANADGQLLSWFGMREELEFNLPIDRNQDINLTLESPAAVVPAIYSDLVVAVDGTKVPYILETGQPVRLKIRVPCSSQSADTVVRVVPSKSVSPKSLGVSEDSRLLSLSLSEVSWEPGPPAGLLVRLKSRLSKFRMRGHNR